MITEQAARGLVTAYVRAYHEVWKSAVERYAKEVDFDDWAEIIAALDHHYFAPGGGSGYGTSFGDHPDLDPTTEELGAFVPGADVAVLASTVKREYTGEYHEWELVLVAGQPRLKKLRTFLDAKGTPNVDPDLAEEVLSAASSTAALRALDDAPPDEAALFAAGRELTIAGSPATISVRALGSLVTESGILSARDLGYDPSDLAAFARKVPPGTYAVDVSVAADTVLALRVRLSDEPVVAWHPADLGGGNHVVGVDAANVAIFDAVSFTKIDAWTRERLYEKHVVEGGNPFASVFALQPGGVTDGAIATSGYGDGAYPCFWGVDAAGNIARLVVDFLVLG